MQGDTSSHYSSCSSDDSSSDYTSESDSESPITNSLADQLLAMTPQPYNPSILENSRNNSRKLISKVKSALKNNQITSTKRSGRVESKKNIEECFKDLQGDFIMLAKKFNTLYEIFPEMIETIESLESRITASEERINKIENSLKTVPKPKNPTPFRDALVSCDSQRIDKLEYLSSEEERKKRSLEVLITDPSITDNATNLQELTQKLFTDKLKMTSRELDSQFLVRKANRSNTVIVKFSNHRFKKFMFTARKNLRATNSSPPNMYLNDHLTPYNHKILMELKKRRKMCSSGADPFKSIYTFDGRVYVKLNNSTDQEGKNIRNIEQMNSLLTTVIAITPEAEDAVPSASSSTQ